MARTTLVGFTSKISLAKSLGISRQALYYHPKRPAKDEVLREKILTTLSKHPAYGHRRIALALGMNKKRVLRVMRHYHIRPSIVRKGGSQRFNREIAPQVIPNRLKTIPTLASNTIWVGDFTCLWFHCRYVYLATVMDYYTREIIAWQIGLHHTASLVLDVLIEAKRKRKKTPQLFHSDQGSEYTSQACVQWLTKNNITPSNSPKGKPWTNGRQESFYSSFKLEFGKPTRFTTLELLIEGIGKYIHYYNTSRIHGALKMPPRMFYEQQNQNKKDPTFLGI